MSLYYLADSDKSDSIFRLGEIIIYDAIGKPDIGSLTVETISEGQKYLLTVIANDDFLSDPNTVYPVTIDPSITVSDNTDGANSIEDAPIFAGYPNTNCGAFLYNRVGTPNSTYGIGRTVVKLSGLINSDTYQSITAPRITNVAFYAKESSGGSRQFINLYPLAHDATWTESTVTWNNIGNYLTTINCGATMYNNQWTAFDITYLVQSWKYGIYSANAGFIMTNENETGNNKSFDSSECSTSANRPYVTMTYTTDISLNYTRTSIVEGGTRTLVATTNPSGQAVTWSTSNSTIATVSAAGVVTAKKAGTATITARMVDADGIARTASCIIHVYIASGVYRLKNVDNGMYLDVTGGGVTAGTEIQQWSRATSDTNRNQLFKIVYLGTYGNTNLNYYCIRSMTNSAMGVSSPYTTTGEDVTLQSLPTTDTWSGTPYAQSWAISRYGSNYTIRNGHESYNSYLSVPNNSINGERVLNSTTITTKSQWILEPYTGDPIEYVRATSFKSKIMSGETYDYDVIMYSSVVGENGPVTYRVRESDYYSTTDKATVNATTGELTALKSGIVKLGVTYPGAPHVWWWTIEIKKGTIEDLLIYQTRNRERLGFANAKDVSDITPITAEDLTYGQKSTHTLLTNGTLISMSDLYASGGFSISISERVGLIKSFFNSQISYDPTFTTILSEMVDHFVDGSGTDYSNTALTNAVKNHPNTQIYVNEVVDIVKAQITAANGDAESLYYDEQLWLKPVEREQHVIVNSMLQEINNGNKNLYLPYYGYNNGVPGLTLAIDGWYGNKIVIESLEIHDGSYSGILRFTFYDHFGLDTSDLSDEKYANLKAGMTF